MLAVEGADCLGKTTLIRAIANKLAEIAEVNPPEICALTSADSNMTVDDYARKCSPWTIYDRFHLSELVYGRSVPGRTANLDAHQCSIIGGLIKAQGGLVVVLRARPVLYSTIVKDDSLFKRSEQEFSTSICEQANSKFYNLPANAFGVCRSVQVTQGVTRAGIDWPASRALLVEEIARQYLSLQKALGHGIPPSEYGISTARSEDVVTAMSQQLVRSETRVLDGVVNLLKENAGLKPEEYKLIVKRSHGEDGHATYCTEYAFSKKSD